MPNESKFISSHHILSYGTLKAAFWVSEMNNPFHFDPHFRKTIDSIKYNDGFKQNRPFLSEDPSPLKELCADLSNVSCRINNFKSDLE